MLRPDISLLFRCGCPHIGLARRRLEKALQAHDLAGNIIREIDMDAQDCPEDFRNHGSPTILIAGKDVAATSSAMADGPTCRIYPGGNGAPLTDDIAAALARWLDGRKQA